MPNLSILLLPNDHTMGTRAGAPTPRATVADNDLALGRIVERLTRSRFWPKTLILVIEDDSQLGLDHVDGHRTTAFCVSPYTKRGQVVSETYNHTSFLRTIGLVLGLPPMNRFDRTAEPLTACFTPTPDLTPYAHLPNRIPLDEMNPAPSGALRGRQAARARLSRSGLVGRGSGGRRHGGAGGLAQRLPAAAVPQRALPPERGRRGRRRRGRVSQATVPAADATASAPTHSLTEAFLIPDNENKRAVVMPIPVAAAALLCLLPPPPLPPPPAPPVATAPATAPATTPASAAYAWKKLETEPSRSEQDDIFFLGDARTSWYGSGKVFGTTDGGVVWAKLAEKPGTYFRCLAFLDEQHGFAGNIGTGYFPGVADETPLYETRNRGKTWAAVGPDRGVRGVRGLCAIDVLRGKPFINAGRLDYRTTITAGGRVGGPAVLLRSEDGGATWRTIDMSAHCGMILDVKFLTPEVGIVCAATDPDVQKSSALILRTGDGGTTWKPVYKSSRPYELTWKCSFPTEKVGYTTIQSYDPDHTVTKRYVAKTSDGGETWSEVELADDFACREFGVGFADENTGWVGAAQTGYQTIDGGRTWTKTPMGAAVNKIRVFKTPTGVVGYAIGLDVYRLDTRTPESPGQTAS
jgi:photosystem II stability/assembly factor-like uncharacterized protein